MAVYSDYDKERLLRTPIQDVLAHYGKDCRPVSRNMYLSPLREETNASFCINPRSNTWYDFGTGEGGGVIDIVCRLSGCARKEAYDVLSVINGRYPETVGIPHSRKADTREQESPIVIEYISQRFTNRALIVYAAGRGIPKEVLDANCQQICYHLINRPDRQTTAIGFMNDKGGYSLRNSRTKISNSSYVSTIAGTSGTGAVMVFEGFFDFLSFLADNGITRPESSVCVLNGVGNVAHSIPFLEGFSEILLYLDNDSAGKKTAETITEHLSSRTKDDGVIRNVRDMSHTYMGFKDYNSMLCDRTEKESLPSNNTQYGTIKGRPGETGQDQLG